MKFELGPFLDFPCLNQDIVIGYKIDLQGMLFGKSFKNRNDLKTDSRGIPDFIIWKSDLSIFWYTICFLLHKYDLINISASTIVITMQFAADNCDSVFTFSFNVYFMDISWKWINLEKMAIYKLFSMRMFVYIVES